MFRVDLSPLAVQDVEKILDWASEYFGADAVQRYKVLLIQAIDDVAVNPHLNGSVERTDVAKGMLTYHLANSRSRVPRSAGRVKQPRHFLLYRIASSDLVQIIRVLHDSMDLSRHLPEDLG